MTTVILVDLLSVFPTQKMKTIDLVLFEDNAESFFQKVNSFLQVNYVQHIVHAPSYFLPFFGFLPV